jgi:uncharacterized membrane protein
VYARLLEIWETLRTSFWAVPALMILGSIGLAYATLVLDRSEPLEDLDGYKFLFRGGPEAAREMLSIIAGSMITIAGVVFSITIVVLSLASNQLGPRLIRNFVHDGLNQIVLGTFTSTFVFCILILLNVRGEDYSVFVPQASVTAGLALALLSIGVLITFIHHIAQQIQVPRMIASVGHEIGESMDRIVPLPEDPPTPQDLLRAVAALPVDSEGGGRPLYSTNEGYVTLLDITPLVRLAQEHDLLIRLVRGPGDFIIHGSELARVWTKWELPEDIGKQVTRSFSFGRTRSPVQDLGFAYNQLVEIGVRALSPSTNDPFSAMSCLDHLGAGLSKMARRPPPYPYHFDKQGKLRVVERSLDFATIAERSLTPLRIYGRSSLPVMLHFLEVLENMADAVPREPERRVLLGHALRALDSTLEQTDNAEDRRLIEDAFAAAKTALEKAGQ